MSVLYTWGFRPRDLTCWWVSISPGEVTWSGSRAGSHPKGPYHGGSLLRIPKAVGALGSSATGVCRGRHSMLSLCVRK